MIGNFVVAQFLEDLWKSSENGRESSENRQKGRYHAVSIFSKQSNTRLLVDMEYLDSCSTLYLTHSLRSLVEYQA